MNSIHAISPVLAVAGLLGFGGSFIRRRTTSQTAFEVVPKVQWRPLSGQGRTVVGIDFGAESIKLVQIRRTRRGPRLENYAVVATPPGAISDGVAANPDGLAAALGAIYASQRIGQRRVGSVVGGPAVLIRHVNYPQMTRVELERALKWDIDQHLPIPGDQAVFDFTIIDGMDSAPAGQMAVMIVGTNRRNLDGYLKVFRKCRLKPWAIELDALADLRALRFMGYVPRETGDPFVVLDLGLTGTRINIFHNGVPLLSRTVAPDGRALTQALVDQLKVPWAEAEKIKREQGLTPGTMAEPVLRPLVTELLSAVTRSAEFFMIQNRGRVIRQAFLLGGGASMPELEAAVAESLSEGLSRNSLTPVSVEVRVAVPPNELAIHPRLNPFTQHLGPQLATALGAALREEPEQ